MFLYAVVTKSSSASSLSRSFPFTLVGWFEFKPTDMHFTSSFRVIVTALSASLPLALCRTFLAKNRFARMWVPPLRSFAPADW